MELPPISRAIVKRSVGELEQCIFSNPKAVNERVWGYSTIQLSAAWPEGLGVLLRTDARNLVYDDKIGNGWRWPTTLALGAKCEVSLAMLTEAGFGIYFGFYGVQMSPECVLVVARILFERRIKLFELAQGQLQDFKDEYTYDTSEKEARCLNNKLTAAGIPVDPGLEVGHDYTTVFHNPALPLDHFRIFFENGFHNHFAHDELGLTAAMIHRWNPFSASISHKSDYLSTLQWLQDERILDHSPRDPYNLGLNIKATGWHYLAALIGIKAYPPVSNAVLQQLSQSSVRDTCTCWCIPGGEGCTPLGSILKAHAESHNSPSWWNHFVVGALFSSECEDQGSSIMAHIVRFLTFEALEMTHTCCHCGVLDRCTLQSCTSDNGHPAYDYDWRCNTPVILDCDTVVVQETRADVVQQRNAVLLDSLMEEFSRQLGGADATRGALNHFLNGFWRRRMATVFAVDEDILDEMKECLGEVKTRKC